MARCSHTANVLNCGNLFLAATSHGVKGERFMALAPKASAQATSTVDEPALIRLAQARQPDAIRTIITRYNQRLYRLARSITRNDADAEDVVQEAYLH